MILNLKHRSKIRFWNYLRKFCKKIFLHFLKKILALQKISIGLIGKKGAGKTSYIARYYHYTKRNLHEPWNVFCENPTTQKYIQQALENLEQGRFQPTQKSQQLHLLFYHKHQETTLCFRIHALDIAGNEFHPQALTKFPKWDAIFLAIDPSSIQPNDGQLYEQILLHFTRTSNPPPVAIVFTKLDSPNTPPELKNLPPPWEEENQPNHIQLFAQQHLPELTKLLQTYNFPTQYFAISAFGDWIKKKTSHGKILVPDPDKPPIDLHLPLLWLCKQCFRQRKRKFLLLLLWLLLLASLASLWILHHN